MTIYEKIIEIFIKIHENINLLSYVSAIYNVCMFYSPCIASTVFIHSQ